MDDERFLEWVIQHDALMDFLTHNIELVEEYFGDEWGQLSEEEKEEFGEKDEAD